MRILRLLLMVAAAVVLAGTIASAAPPIRAVLGDRPSPSASVAPEPSPTEDLAERSESPSLEPVETGSPSAEPSGVEEATTAPDFSACLGLHGLENAICRHEALLAVDPENVGLKNSLERLPANQARHEEHAVDHSEGHAVDHDGGNGSCPGQSCEPHGNGNGHG